MLVGTHTVHLRDYRQPKFRVDPVDLYFNLDVSTIIVNARLDVHRRGDHAEPLSLNGNALALRSLSLGGELLRPGDYRTCKGRNEWRRYDGGRALFMEKLIKRILDAPNLSRDVREIGTKSLQEHQ